MINFLIDHCRYIDNICKNPEEEKYRKIKVSNKVFQVGRRQNKASLICDAFSLFWILFPSIRRR